MDVLGPSEVLLFNDFRLDPRGLFRRDEMGTFAPVKIGTRALDVLQVLINRAGQLVEKDDIIAAVWPDTVVEDSNLTMQISLLRRILGAGAADGCCIQTVAGRGYRFVAPIKRHGLVSDYSLLGSRPKFSLVVLPFANLNSDADHQYLVDGITEDLTTDLSRVGDMVVISRNTAFTYQGKRIATRQIGRELGVRYVLEGSVRRIGDQVRINAQLIDAETDSHLWAERFDRRVGDLFALQDEVVSRIATALNLELAIAEAGRRVERPDAMDCIFRGRAALAQPLSLDTSNRAIEWFERALSLDSGSAEAQARLAWELANRVLDFLPTTSAAALDRAECLARQAVTTSPRSALTHFALATVFRAERRYVEAIAEYETTLELDRNWVSALAAMGRCKIFIGPIDDAIPAQERAIRLSPRDPRVWNWYYRIGQAHLLQSRLDEAIGWLERAHNANPGIWFVHVWLAAAYAQRERMAEARAELVTAKRLRGEDFERGVTLLGERIVAPEIRDRFETIVRAGLQKAGMLEEQP